MTGTQIAAAVAEFNALRKELSPVENGFGFDGLKITVKTRAGEQWELAELSVTGDVVRGIGRQTIEKDKPTRWFAVHFDPADISWVEYETFPG